MKPVGSAPGLLQGPARQALHLLPGQVAILQRWPRHWWVGTQKTRGKDGKIWENMGRYGKRWENMGKYGEKPS